MLIFMDGPLQCSDPSFYDREAREIMYLVASVCLCVCVCKGCHYQSESFVCLAVIRGRLQIISRMQSLGFLIALWLKTVPLCGGFALLCFADGFVPLLMYQQPFQ